MTITDTYCRHTTPHLHPRTQRERFSRIGSIVLLIGLAAFVQACTDAGNPPTSPLLFPVITTVVPDSAAVQDTITIIGTNFGSDPSSGAILIGDSRATQIVAWSSTEIRVAIPQDAHTSAIIVRVNGNLSNPRPYRIIGTVQAPVSFARDVQPIFLNNCALSGCHTPSALAGNFNASTYATLRSGGFTFGTSVIIPGDSSASAVMQLIRSNNNLIGLRMPLGGPYKETGLPDSLIVRIGRWIVEGALNN